MVGAVGGEPVCFLQGAKVDFLAGLALPIEANGLDLDDVVRLFLQVPKDTRATGGVDLPNESLHVPILPLGTGNGWRATETTEPPAVINTEGKLAIRVATHKCYSCVTKGIVFSWKWHFSASLNLTGKCSNQ